MKAILLGLVEGLTEFIPVSSTGHLIVTGDLLQFKGSAASTFEVFIQLGAILAVLIVYKERFYGLLDFKKREGLSGMNGLILLAITTTPALIFGFLVHGYIKTYLFNPFTVALGLGVGGVIMIVAESKLPRSRIKKVDELKKLDALWVGLFQCLAMWPGVSRSGATIVGGMLVGIERKTAAEYSFLAAVPVMFAATAYDLFKSRAFLSSSDIPIFIIGFVVSFISAWFAIKFFIHLLGKWTLKPFGWYRIVIALLILAYL